MRIGPQVLALMFATMVLSTAFDVSASTIVYDQTLHGGLSQTGNAIGLSKEFSANGPGTEGSIGTFITTNLASQDIVPPNPLNPWYVGTTSAWQQQSSAAVLILPEGATVTHAQLVWGGSFDYLEDVIAYLNDAVSLSFSAEPAVSVAPDPALSVTIAEYSPGGFPANYYQRSADVTSYVAARGGGQYEVGAIPATQNEMINSLNAGGWALLVAFQDNSEVLRAVQIHIVGDYVDEESSSTVVFSGFEASDLEVVRADLFVAAMEGDADRNGDQLLLRDASSTLQPLSTSERPEDNFFPSIIADGSGALDTSGTFGNRNHAAGQNSIGARQGWDITGIPLLSTQGHLTRGQQSLEIVASTIGDEYLFCLAGLAIDVVDKVTAADGQVPAVARLHDCYPNPFNPSTTISYSVPRAGHVELAVYDIAGRLVRTLVSRDVPAGEHRSNWNGIDNAGEAVASGVYLYRLSAGAIVETKRMVLLK